MKKLPLTVYVLGVVSFSTDLSSEMIYPLLPIFLSTTLGAGALALGLIEGIAESTASLFKVASGIWTDRTSRRKPLIVGGYGLSGLVRPLIALASIWPVVLILRFTDRIGKGLRSSPRDALVADVTDPGQRGAAFGLHRSMDHAGAVVGPLIAAALLTFGSVSIPHVFLFSAIPSVIVIAVLLAYVREPKKTEATSKLARPSLRGHWQGMSKDFKMLLGAIFLFSLGNSTDAFLLLKMSSVGVPAAWIAVLWSAHHVIKMVSTFYGGRLSDLLGSRGLIIAGWFFYAVIYLAFAVVSSPIALVVVFLSYGVYFGLTEPSEKSWIADIVPANMRGTAFGYYHSVIGIGALPASLLFGFLWHTFGVAVAFMTGSLLALGASALLLTVPPSPGASRVSVPESPADPPSGGNMPALD